MSTGSPAVYIIDADQSVQTAFGRLVKSAGYKAVVCRHNQCSIGPVGHELVGCVILDIGLMSPVSVGMLKMIRQQGIYLPVIAVSTYDYADVRLLVQQLGAQLFLRKPVDGIALLKGIDLLLGGGGALNAQGMDRIQEDLSGDTTDWNGLIDAPLRRVGGGQTHRGAACAALPTAAPDLSPLGRSGKAT